MDSLVCFHLLGHCCIAMESEGILGEIGMRDDLQQNAGNWVQTQDNCVEDCSLSIWGAKFKLAPPKGFIFTVIVCILLFFIPC